MKKKLSGGKTDIRTILALFIFVILVGLTFLISDMQSKRISTFSRAAREMVFPTPYPSTTPTESPNPSSFKKCRPRPACLDLPQPCQLAIPVEGWCEKK